MQYNGSRVAFEIFGVQIYWYAILIVTGMALAVILAARELKRIDGKEDHIYDLALFLLPLAVIGARVYYVIFEWDRYDSIWDMIDIRSGGLAIHGGVIVGIIVGIIYARAKKIRFLTLSDVIMIFLPLAQAIGRWGNFFNNEAYGYETDLPWALIIDGKGHHPTFLYESIGNVLIFITLFYFFRNKQKRFGQTTSLYLIFYGILRFIVESFRTDSLWIGPFRTAQITSILFVVAGVALLLYLKRQPENQEELLERNKKLQDTLDEIKKTEG